MDFVTELKQLINKHSREKGSSTPDFILAKYLESCLAAFDGATRARDLWYGDDGQAHEHILVVPQSPIYDLVINGPTEAMVNGGKLMASSQTFALLGFVPRLNATIWAAGRGWVLVDFNPNTDEWCGLPAG